MAKKNTRRNTLELIHVHVLLFLLRKGSTRIVDKALFFVNSQNTKILQSTITVKYLKTRFPCEIPVRATWTRIIRKHTRPISIVYWSEKNTICILSIIVSLRLSVLIMGLQHSNWQLTSMNPWSSWRCLFKIVSQFLIKKSVLDRQYDVTGLNRNKSRSLQEN